MADVTIKDTKQVIFDRLHETEKKLKELQAGKSNPVAEAKKVEVKKAMESAEESVKEGIFSDDLNQKYNDVMTAISVGEDRIKELYGVEKELINLTTVINAHKDEVSELESEAAETEKAIQDQYDAMRQRLDAEITDYRIKIREEEETLRKTAAMILSQLETERKREKEEYSYNLKRERAKEEDAWEDQKAERKAAIAQAEATVDAAWDEVKAKQDYIVELEEKVAAIPALLAEAQISGAEAKDKELGKEYGYKKSMMEKEHGYAVSRLEDKVNYLETELAKTLSINSSLQEKLEDAYAKVQEIATKTVEANGKINIIGSGQESKR